MSRRAYWPGQAVRYRVLVTDPDTGVAIDPTGVVTFQRLDPAGVETSFVVGVASQATHPAVGDFRLAYPAAKPLGDWRVQIQGAGTNYGADRQEYTVIDSPFSLP